ncbi:MBL fold metallo-hydrolase [Paracoccus sp. p3-h83]|uniref:MBL fold metallo-hydrolase n=1 Tax=Paracoccus sp. p3-h83 TaxID=3342805 RepID=UPI0035B761AB
MQTDPTPLPDGLRLIRADNPGPLTGPGTNSFILGRGRVAIVDPGPDDPAHLAAILAALTPDEKVAAILLTHAHLDHSALAPRLSRAVGAPVMAFGGATDGRSAVMQALAQAGLAGGGEGLDKDLRPDRCLADGETISLGGLSVTALHTPGHAAGHLAFACDDPAIGILTGDVVLGWASTLISPPDGDLGDYLRTLDRLAARGARVLRPAHGGPITDPAARLAELAAHRALRMDQIRARLAQGPARPAELVAAIYTETPPALWPAATRNVLAHLIFLVEQGEVTARPALSADAVFALTA